MIRPRDPEITTPTLAYGPYSSAEACRRMLQLAYRDCYTVLDLTYAAGGFWKGPYPPEVIIQTNNLDPRSDAHHHEDFTKSYFHDKSFDLVVYDPPHVADGGVDGIMANRFGTAKGSDGLYELICRGMEETLRVARLGVLVKVTDYAHGGRWLSLTRWVHTVANSHRRQAHLYAVIHTYRPAFMDDPKWQVQRVPRSNGAVYMAFRLDGPNHRDFDREYERQEGRR